MLHTKLGLAVILICAFASGCVFRPVYGEFWAKQVKVESDACPVIDGNYQNAGEMFSKAKHDTYEHEMISLAHLMNRWDDIGAGKADKRLGMTFADPAEDAYQTVSLRLVKGKLHIEASLADGGARAFDLPTRQQCRDSTVVLEADWFDDGEAISGRKTLALGRAEDGSLLVYEAATEFFWLWPIPSRSASWKRFPPVAPAPRRNFQGLSTLPKSVLDSSDKSVE